MISTSNALMHHVWAPDQKVTNSWLVGISIHNALCTYDRNKAHGSKVNKRNYR